MSTDNAPFAYYSNESDYRQVLALWLSLLMPVFAVILGVWLLDDPLGVNKLVGGALVVAGLAVINLRLSKFLPWPGKRSRTTRSG
ncbi:EamA family transporter [Modicisalibacter radicis]|uniref:EamA family transporter n=1 Tax=Halomonas sp. EAR18 TaxID=2518972 RepID=UPI001FCEDB27|nr:EamA family transporter [Halomonas sp. EAR18]